MTLPVVDVAPLLGGGDPTGTGRQIAAACEESGFFYISGHGVDPALLSDLDAAARRFFALPDEQKRRIEMVHGGAAWRGWFPEGGELTDGRPDRKEGIYLGFERPATGRPLEGPNLFPDQVPELKPAVLAYLDAVTDLAQAVLGGIALGLGLPQRWFADGCTADPTVLFRIFTYPPGMPADEWGVAQHTDYGLLTVLLQDEHGGLQVRTPQGWLDAPPIDGTFVCNIGDMLAELSGGRFRSTPHRVRNTGAGQRLSFPLFLDPGWDAEVPGIGRYGPHLLTRIGKVFPELFAEVL